MLISGLEIFKDHLVINERSDGITKIRVANWSNLKDSHIVDFGEETYAAFTSTNPEFDSDKVRLYFSSMTTPASTYDYDMNGKTLDLMKQQEVVGDFDSSDYASERIEVTARDGAKVPVSIVYKKGLVKNGQAPCLLYTSDAADE